MSFADSKCDNVEFINLLKDQAQPDDQRLPDRGRSVEIERHLGSCFICDSDYGTRASTVVRVGREQIFLRSRPI